MNQPEKLLTVKDVAAILVKDEETIRRWIKKRVIVFIKMPGGDYRIRHEHLNNWLDSRTVKAKSNPL